MAQGCQKAYFQTKNTKFEYIFESLAMATFCGHLVYFVVIRYIYFVVIRYVYFVVIWYILYPFGMFYVRVV
jgi:hypothetical protein